MILPKVLLIEPDLFSQEILKKNLVARNIDVFSCETGRHALRLIPGLSPNLVVLELKLPDISGLEVARRLRYSSVFVGLPIVAVTNSCEVNLAEQALGLSFNDYLVRPDASLNEIVNRILWNLRL